MARRSFEVEDGKVTNYRPPKGRSGQSDSEFVDLELSKEEKAALREFAATMEELDEELEGLFKDGTKVTTRWDDRNSCYVAFAFAADGSDNVGYILTGRGGSASRAIRQLLFKNRVLLAGEWFQYHNRSSNGTGDDW